MFNCRRYKIKKHNHFYRIIYIKINKIKEKRKCFVNYQIVKFRKISIVFKWTVDNDLNNNNGVQRNSIYRIQIESGQVESELFKYNTLRETELDLFNAEFAYTFDRSRSVFSFI